MWYGNMWGILMKKKNSEVEIKPFKLNGVMYDFKSIGRFITCEGCAFEGKGCIGLRCRGEIPDCRVGVGENAEFYIFTVKLKSGDKNGKWQNIKNRL